MRIRLLIPGLTYAVFLFALLLFPPFHDGHHHFYSWRPDETQLVAFLPPLASGDWLQAHLSELLSPDRGRLVFEVLIGLAFCTLFFLTLELIACFRNYRRNAAQKAAQARWAKGSERG